MERYGRFSIIEIEKQNGFNVWTVDARYRCVREKKKISILFN